MTKRCVRWLKSSQSAIIDIAQLSWLGLAYDRLPSTFRKGNPSSDTDKALALSDAIAALIKQLDLMSTLAEYKVPQEDLEGIANKVVTALSRSVKIGVPEAGEVRRRPFFFS